MEEEGKEEEEEDGERESKRKREEKKKRKKKKEKKEKKEEEGEEKWIGVGGCSADKHNGMIANNNDEVLSLCGAHHQPIRCGWGRDKGG